MVVSNSVIQHHNGMREFTVLADYTGSDLGKVLSHNTLLET